MANAKITALTEDTTPADGDFVPTVDVSDTTDAPTGTTKKVQAQNLVVKKLRTSTGPAVLTVGAVADGEFLKRSGTSIISAAGTSVLTVDSVSSPVFAQDAGANDTYTATLSPVPSGYTTGTHYRFKANTANTGAATINFNSLGAKTIKKAAGGITTDLADNDIRAGQWVDLIYDGTNMQMQSGLGNAASGGATINATDGYIPRRLNSTTFSDSKLQYDSGNSGQTITDSWLIFTNGTTKGISFSNFHDLGGLVGAQKGTVKVTTGDGSTPGTILSNFATPPLPGGQIGLWSSQGMNYRHVMTSNMTIQGPANHGGDGTAPSGYRVVLMLVQDGTGSRTATWSSDLKFPGGTTPTLTTAANAVDVFEFICFNDIGYCIGQFLDVK